MALWSVSTSRSDADLDRAVLVGEAEGRWLWLVLRPASALLLLRDDWILRDVSHGSAPGGAAVRRAAAALVTGADVLAPADGLVGLQRAATG